MNPRRLILERDELQATKDYTPGTLYYCDRDGEPVEICKSIERGWRENRPNVSCVPAGWYQLEPWVRPNGQQVYIITGNGCVIGPQNLDPSCGNTRWGILIHTANYWHQLEGCVAPVSEYVGDGTGWRSGDAMRKVRAAMNPHFSCHATAQIEIRLATAPELVQPENSSGDA